MWSRTVTNNACACVGQGTTPTATVPINRLNVRSFITNVTDGAQLRRGGKILKGIAFDGGTGIKNVEVSVDGGNTWKDTRLGRNYGRYAFREWKTPVRLSAGPHEWKVRATSNGGDVQPAEATWNPAGYMRNLTETVRVSVS